MSNQKLVKQKVVKKCVYFWVYEMCFIRFMLKETIIHLFQRWTISVTTVIRRMKRHIILDGIKSVVNFIVKKAADFVIGGFFSVFSRISSMAYRALTWSTPTYYIWFIFYAPEIEDEGGGHIVFVLSVILSFCPPLWNFNLANNFWTVSARELWYFTWIFPVIRPLRGYHFLLSWSLTLFYSFNVGNNFWTVGARFLVIHMSILWDNTNTFDLETLEFDPLLKKNV